MKRLPLILATVLLSGCGLLGGKTPPSLMALSPAATVAAQTNRSAASGETITVIAPSLVQEINTNRVPVRSGASRSPMSRTRNGWTRPTSCSATC